MHAQFRNLNTLWIVFLHFNYWLTLVCHVTAAEDSAPSSGVLLLKISSFQVSHPSWYMHQNCTLENSRIIRGFSQCPVGESEHYPRIFSAYMQSWCVHHYPHILSVYSGRILVLSADFLSVHAVLVHISSQLPFFLQLISFEFLWNKKLRST